MTGGTDDASAKHPDGCILHDGCGDAVLRAADRGASVLADVGGRAVDCESGPTSPATIADQSFGYRIEKTTSAVLVVLMYLTNWWSVYSGHAPYVPDWAIGVALYGFGCPWYEKIKDRIIKTIESRVSGNGKD